MSAFGSIGAATGCMYDFNTEQADIKSERILPYNPGDPETLPDRFSKSVLVIGGGIAGLSAAYTLVKKGFKVTLREAAPYLGGRLHTRKEKLSVGDFNVEHGLHMWFYQYYNFKKILKELGVWDTNFKDFNEVFFTFKEYEEEVIKSEGPYPLNLVKIIRSSPNLNMLNAAQTFRALPDIIFYNHRTHFAKFDNINFYDWAASTGVNRKFFDIVMKPAASVTLNTPENLSASEMLMYMHFYFIGHPKAFQRRVTTTDHGTAVIDPWARRIEELGGVIEISSPVDSLRFSGDRCIGTNDSDIDYDHVVVATDVPGIKKIMPASYSNDRFTQSAIERLNDKFSGLEVAPKYHVLRIWLDKPLSSKLTPEQAVIECSDHKPINLMAIFEMLEDESREWAERTGGSILELHLYDTPEFGSLTPEQIWEEVRAEVIGAFAQTEAYDLIQEATPLDYSLGRFENFTSFAPGQAAFKPVVREGNLLGIEGLYFAGDWVQCDLFPNALMERAVTTGIEAANAIFFAESVRQVEVDGASSRGPGIFPQF